LLRRAGWEPIHVWEHEPVEVAAERVSTLVARRSNLTD
jgi:hypothetical protein